MTARATLRGDLGAAVFDAAAAALVATIVFLVLFLHVRTGTDPALREMPSMLHDGGIWPYSVSQAVGWSALLWAWLTTLLGVSLPIFVNNRQWRLRAIVERLHRSTSLTVIVLMVTHAVLLVWDKMGDTLFSVFVPYATHYVPGRFPEALGIMSFYLAFVLGVGFYLRAWIGLRRWRWLHRWIIPCAYVLAVWHTFEYGSDVRAHNLLWYVAWAMQVPIIFAFALRLAGPPRQGSRDSQMIRQRRQFSRR
ncbi:MAG TPA: hypothetical protein VKR31_15485 [Rhizomicrobium sp.]|nr:hypothetical protein [Rhizomicrobium sp.]